jgi:hypothetical protein
VTGLRTVVLATTPTPTTGSTRTPVPTSHFADAAPWWPVALTILVVACVAVWAVRSLLRSAGGNVRGDNQWN